MESGEQKDNPVYIQYFIQMCTASAPVLENLGSPECDAQSQILRCPSVSEIRIWPDF